METTIIKKQDLLTLKAKVKGLAEGGSRCRKFIHATSNERRYHHWDVKRSIGKEARYHLLAYGLLRGLAYKELESNSNLVSKDPARRMDANYHFDYSYLAQICQRHCGYGDRAKWSPANIQRLITTGTMSIPAKVVEKVAS